MQSIHGSTRLFQKQRFAISHTLRFTSSSASWSNNESRRLGNKTLRIHRGAFPPLEIPFNLLMDPLIWRNLSAQSQAYEIISKLGGQLIRFKNGLLPSASRRKGPTSESRTALAHTLTSLGTPFY